MLRSSLLCSLLSSLVLSIAPVSAQLLINEGSSRNAHTIADATGDHPDWIELYNADNTAIDLEGYTLSDDPLEPTKWTFPSVQIPAQGFLIVFCSGDDHGPLTGMTTVVAITDFDPVEGWNSHALSTLFNWDGASNLMIQTCALREEGNGLNAIFNQTTTPFFSSAYVNGHDPLLTCGMTYGDLTPHRPVMRFNGTTIGSNDWSNSFVQLPAPYANWYGGAKNAFFLKASELVSAGLTAGPINTIAFDVISTNDAELEQFDIRMALTTDTALTATFFPASAINEVHANFKLGRNGEVVYLFAPGEVLIDSLDVLQAAPDHSNGRSPDGSASDSLFAIPTPGASNNASTPYALYALAPTLSVPSGISSFAITVSITDPDPLPSEVRYTLDGSEPTIGSTLYTGPVAIDASTVLSARVFKEGHVPSNITAASYLIGVHHTTPVISLVTPDEDLNGLEGIFTNWHLDDEIQAHIDYFDADEQLVFSQYTGMQVDGGLGGSRGFPQHSFRLEFDNDVLGDGRVDYPMIANRPERTRYSRIYLRNGSNQFQILPHKDAVQVAAMAGETNSYYSAWSPVTVYINGGYFGLYELREKFDAEYFRSLEQADTDSLDLLSLSAWNGYVLRPTEGEVDPFWRDYAAFQLLDPASPDFWEQADTRFDLTWYTDHIIGQQWMGTVDWPGNNVKIYRSNVTDHRWRFCTIDLEVAMAPNGQTDHFFNGISFTANQPEVIPYTRIWQRSIENPRFHDHFINRFADVMNSAYLNDRILAIAQDYFDQARPEMGLQFERWGGPDTTAALATFEADNAAFMSELEQRTPVVRDDLQQFFALPRQLDVTLDVLPVGAGTIRISTLRPDTYPWQGVYFDGVPVKLEAVANEGWYFSHWTPNTLLNDTLDALFLDTLAADAILFEAHFTTDLPTAGIGPERNDLMTMALYPNPASAELFIQNNNAVIGRTHYQVLDMRGQILQQGVLQAGRKRSTIDIAPLASGPYQLSFVGEEGLRELLRFVKL